MLCHNIINQPLPRFPRSERIVVDKKDVQNGLKQGDQVKNADYALVHNAPVLDCAPHSAPAPKYRKYAPNYAPKILAPLTKCSEVLQLYTIVAVVRFLLVKLDPAFLQNQSWPH